MRPRQLLGAVIGAFVMSAAGCGLPNGGEARVIDDDRVPYQLLETHAAPSGLSSEPSSSAADPVVFWVDESDSLVPAPSDAECGAESSLLVADLLAVLSAGPTEERRQTGESTAIPPESTLRLLELDGSTALIEVAADPQLSMDRLPLAVGQIVLTVSSAPEVDDVVLVMDGEQVQVPLPGGALTPPPVDPSDYASLVPVRYRDSAPFDRRGAECSS